MKDIGDTWADRSAQVLGSLTHLALLKHLAPLKRLRCLSGAWLSALERLCIFCQDLKAIFEHFTQISLRNLLIPNLFRLFAYKYLIITLLGLEILNSLGWVSLRGKPNKSHHSWSLIWRIQLLNLGLKTFIPSVRLKCIHWSNWRLLRFKHESSCRY